METKKMDILFITSVTLPLPRAADCVTIESSPSGFMAGLYAYLCIDILYADHIDI